MGDPTLDRTPPTSRLDDGAEKTKCQSLKCWATQRTTIMGALTLIASVSGLYLGVLDVGTGVTLITFGLTGFIPEQCAFARKMIGVMAPLLAQSIAKHHIGKDNKPPF